MSNIYNMLIFDFPSFSAGVVYGDSMGGVDPVTVDVIKTVLLDL